MERRPTILVSIILIVVGALALAKSLGVEWMRMERLWPIVVIAGGIASIYQGVRERKADSLWFGITVMLCGALFGYITLFAARWGPLATWWPLMVGFAGLGWLGVWLLVPRHWANLALCIASLLACVVLLAIKRNLFTPTFRSLVTTWWPWLLVVAGAALVLQSLLSWHVDADRD